jgi:hypothetical protein
VTDHMTTMYAAALAMVERKIVTSFVNPPIPIRSHDWSAHYEGEEEAGNYGWGRTEAEAIQDFKDYCADAHDARLNKEAAMKRWAGIHDETMAQLAKEHF